MNTNGLNTLKTSGLLSLLTELQAAPPLPRRHGVAPSTTPDILLVRAAVELGNFVIERDFGIISGIGDAPNGTRIDVARGGILAELDVHIASAPFVWVARRPSS